MDMQNVSNLQIPEGLVRTVHDKNNRLLWGRVAYNTKYAGDTFQQTYSGKNLFNYQGVVNLAIATVISARSTYRGYYIQANAGDTFTLSRATTTGNNRFRVCFTMVEPAQGVDVYNENGVVGRYISADGATEVSFTVPQDMHYVFIYLSNSDQDITESLKIQLETGSTATAYEPYVGGEPAPNPDYPQDVNVVTGEQTVGVHGKNLANMFNDGKIPSISNGQLVTGNGVRSDYIPMYGDAQITFSGNTSSTLYCFFYDSGKNFISWTANVSPVSAATPSNTAYIMLRADALATSLQLEFGSTATSYEPYQSQSYTIDLGSIELCKIGNYQDYIYKSGDDWYLHKVINKVILNGSEAWAMYSGRNGTFYITKSDIMPATSISATPDVISDYYEPKPFASLYNMIVDYGVANHNAQRWIAIRNKDYSDVSSFKTWLASNNTTVYYVLATPANTKITDNTLIDQLNAVHQWATRYGYNATVTGNLPIVINRTALPTA